MSVLIRVFVQVCVSLVAVSRGVFLAVMFEGSFCERVRGYFLSIGVLRVGLLECVFLAGVFEGVGGRGWTARCCLGVSHKREAEPAQQCRPPGSWGRYTATAGPRAPPTLFFFFSEHQCLSRAGVHTDLYH